MKGEVSAHAGGRTRFWPGAALVLALYLASISGFCANFTATLDRDTITLGDNATLALTFEGGTPKSLPAVPDVPNLQIVGSGTSLSQSFINGQSTSTITYNFTVTPRQVGDYTIPGFTAELGTEKFSTPPLTLKVLKPTAPPPEAIKSGAQDAFLKLVLARKEIYVGETVVAELDLYLLSRVQNVSQFQLTGFPADGFNVGKMAQGQRRQARVGNALYTLIPIYFPLKAIKAGPMALGPVTARTVVELPSQNRSRGSLLDQFGFRDPFEVEHESLTLATDAENLQLLPLPGANVPPQFNGAVGTYSMNVTAGPTNVAAGDPVTVKIQISGRGTLDSLTLPEQPGWNKFTTYPPTTKLETTDSLGLQGVKTFEQIMVPRDPDIKALPPVVFSFFDPDQKGYRTLSHPPLPLVVRPASATPSPTVVTSARGQESALPAQDIVPNKQRLGSLARIGVPLVRQTWFLALQGVPLLAFFSAFVWRRRADSLTHNPRLRRQRQVAVLIREGLSQLRQVAAANHSDEFFATVFRLLQEQLGERLDLPASAITEAVIDEHLRPRGATESTLRPLQELFQTCNLARYAPVKTSQELSALIPKVEAVLRGLGGLQV